MPIDFITLTNELKQSSFINEVGGAQYITSLINQTPSSLNAEHYAHLVKEQAQRREALQTATELATLAADPKKSLDLITQYLLEASQKAVGSPQGRYFVRNVDYALQPSQEVKYLLQGLIYEKSITVLYGDGGTKKTWSSIYLAVCVSSGLPWGGSSNR